MTWKQCWDMGSSKRWFIYEMCPKSETSLVRQDDRARNPRIWEDKTGGPRVQHRLQQHREVQAGL